MMLEEKAAQRRKRLAEKIGPRIAAGRVEAPERALVDPTDAFLRVGKVRIISSNRRKP